MFFDNHKGHKGILKVHKGLKLIVFVFVPFVPS
jgi:hypothetical protein